MKEEKIQMYLKDFSAPEIFIAFIILGASFGALYDVFRFLRFVFSSKYSVFIIDFLFFIIVSIIFFIFLLGYNYGQVRGYYFTLTLLGFLFYIFTVFRLTYRGERVIADFLRKIMQKCFKSLKKVLQFIRRVYYNSIMLRHKPLRKNEKDGNSDESTSSKNKTK